MKQMLRAFCVVGLAALVSAQNKGIDQACDWATEGDCEEGLECWKGFCKDREPPKITLFFGNNAVGSKNSPANVQPIGGHPHYKRHSQAPDVELKFPGGKKVSCDDLIDNCVGPGT